MAEIILDGVSKHFGATTAVHELSFTVHDGEFMVLLGPTGAGKTTTLRLVAGLEQPDQGHIAIGGEQVADLPPAVRDVCFVFQQYSLYPHLSVYDNLAFPLRSPARRMKPAQIDERVRDVAAMLHITDKLANRATRLSGGEMQRVAIGRALVRQPQVFLMDEPLSSLDAKLRAELRIELKRIQKELGATLLYVTHDQIEAMTMANRIGVIDQGRLIQLGSPRDIYESPINTYVAARLGQPAINWVPPGLIEGTAGPASTATVGLRTEHMEINKANGGGANGRVIAVEHLGDQSHLHTVVGDHRIVSLLKPGDPLRVDDAVFIRARNPLFFDHQGDRLS